MTQPFLTVESLHLGLDGVLPLRELGALPLFLQRQPSGIPGGQGLTHGAGLLGAQIQRDVLLALVQLAQVVLGLGVHHNVDAGDGLADDAAIKNNGEMWFIITFHRIWKHNP